MIISKKTILIIIIIIVIILIAFFILLWTVRGDLLFIGYNKFLKAPSYNRTDRFLKTNNDELSVVAFELSKMDYNHITIRDKSILGEDEYCMEVYPEESVKETLSVPIELNDYIEMLFKNGIQVISCGHDYVNFTLWSTMDESRGIIYSSIGTKPEGEQLIVAKQLSKDHWYYYVHNYEKAKEQNPELFK